MLINYWGEAGRGATLPNSGSSSRAPPEAGWGVEQDYWPGLVEPALLAVDFEV